MFIVEHAALSAWIVMVLAFVVGPAFDFVRVVHTGRTAGSNPIRIKLPADWSWSEGIGNDPLAVENQERVDYGFRHMVAAVLVLPLVVFGIDPVDIPVVIACAGTASAWFLCASWHKWSHGLSRFFDLIGHGAEIVFAQESRTLIGYRSGEIDRMIKHSSDNFGGMTYAEVDTMLRKWRWLSTLLLRIYGVSKRTTAT